MKKVAILTITNSGMNFGNRLQNYALQEALLKCGAEVSTIRSAKSVKNSFFLSKCRRYVKSFVRYSKRRGIYNKFENTYINYDKKIRFENINESEFADRYDAFVAAMADDELEKEKRFQIVGDYARFCGAPIEGYQDYGWDPVELYRN